MSRVVSSCLSLFVFASPLLASDSQRTLLRDALTSFDLAISDKGTDEEIRANYNRSAAAFEALIAQGIQNPALYYNLANAYYRIGDVGRSVLNYRRAERLDPANTRIASNLQQARQRVTPFIEPAEQAQIQRQLFFWHYSLSRDTRLWIGLWLSSLGWALLLVAVWLRRRAWGILGGIILLHGFGAASSVAVDLRNESNTPSAVIVDAEPLLRMGRGAGQDVALSEPLGPGIELRVLSERAGWLEIELVDGQTGWIPAEGVEFVPPDTGS